MAIITLKYDAGNPLAKKTIDFIMSLGVFEKKIGLDEAIDDVKKGRVYKAENAKDVINQCLK